MKEESKRGIVKVKGINLWGVEDEQLPKVGPYFLYH